MKSIPRTFPVARLPSGKITMTRSPIPTVTWAAVRIREDRFQDNAEKYVSITAGLYAQFTIQGNEVPANLYQYIFTTWMSESPYQLDDRPHFDKLWPDPHQRGTVSKQVICIPII